MYESTDRRHISSDDNGFLDDPACWSAHLAVRTARQLGVGELAVEHWCVIERLRRGWLDDRRLPVQRHLCRELDLDRDCITMLFGGLIEAWKVAGLPDPGEEARIYMEDMETDDTITDDTLAANTMTDDTVTDDVSGLGELHSGDNL
ncbi:MAG: TusE/DsrC/DsvC family sulfur relay protein [Thiohalocapsa sp.]|uniref:TusE/DsrC/DsvC family sulfur relay protein n=1 Tax=Thiohalocapsa sp. TaxID=2497641 RepID=UPI0025DDECE7|nr:TusE/DsrC/DsvC family sulfur relay protein [Thiohalocapsa sp.]MCG6943513.1 TusE/DsrC/DsvC family sulfur relay protein [Thiohalocapsa sp.]